MWACIYLCYACGLVGATQCGMVGASPASKAGGSGFEPLPLPGLGVQGRRARLNHCSSLHLTRIELVTFSVLG